MRISCRFIARLTVFSAVITCLSLLETDGRASVTSTAAGKKAKAEKKLQIVKGPYLQWPTQNSVTIMWETSCQATSRITYFRTARVHVSAKRNKGLFKTLYETERKLQDKSYCRIHELTLTGLDVDTTYNYKITSEDGQGQSVESELFSLKTAVAKNTPFSFAVTSETMGDPEAARKVFKQIELYRPEFLLLVGDVVKDGRIYEQWDKYLFAPARNLLVNTPFYLCLGNHEECSPWYYKLVSYPQPENYYSFDYGNSHFVAVDCTSEKDYKNGVIVPNDPCRGFLPGSKQYRFLVNDLKSSDATWKFVFFHYPVYVSGDYQVEQLRVLCPIFEKYGVDIVFNSHNIVYERSHPLRNNRIDMQNGVVYIVAGGAGATPGWFHCKRAWHTAQAIAVPHFVQVIIAENTLELNAIDQDGHVFDRIRWTK